jgi:hypothetical protein
VIDKIFEVWIGVTDRVNGHASSVASRIDCRQPP